MQKLEDILKNYSINGKITNQTEGPVLKIIEFTPEAGTKLKNITSVTEDIRRELGVSSLRIEASSETNAILFQIPKENADIVDFKSQINSSTFDTAKSKYALPIYIGADIKGNPVVADLSKMPHLLVGGTTGSGKSVGLNSFILSLISAKKPSELKFVLIDPKKIEFSVYNNQKYLYHPVITETNDAVAMLSHLAQEMDKRYEILAESMCKNIADYNQKGEGHLPYIVCVIDEFADLIATDKNVEKDVIRLAQKARASGIHLILATQRPSVDVVTGVLKANFPTRLSFKVASSADSRTILDTQGAEDLIGRGDALYLASNGELKRIHGGYMSDNDIIQMLKPYQAKVKAQKLQANDTTNTKETKEKKQDGWFKRMIKAWGDLRVKDREMIINAIKAVFKFIFALFINNSKKKK